MRALASVLSSFVVGLLLVSLGATPVRAGVPADLVGAWHTVSIDGDALFFIVHGVEVDFRKNGTFDAHIRFTDGSTETKTGTFELDGDEVSLRVPSIDAKEHGTLEIKDHVLTFHDASFGVTIKLDRGKAKDATGHELF